MYESLSKRYRDQDSRTVFAHFPWREDMGETWENAFARLADKARTEPWITGYRKNGREYPVLAAYLNHTFLRLQEQDKIRYNAEDNRACLNTGLQTPNGLDIYATFYRNLAAHEYDQPDWTLFGFFDAYSDRVREFDPLPQMATYIDNPLDLVLDFRLPLEADYRQIVHDFEERLPNVLWGNPMLAQSALEGAATRAMDRARRQYNLAVPAWFNNRVQLLLPLSLLNLQQTDLALLVERDDEAERYVVRSISSLDVAYVHARILAPIGHQWLSA